MSSKASTDSNGRRAFEGRTPLHSHACFPGFFGGGAYELRFRLLVLSSLAKVEAPPKSPRLRANSDLVAHGLSFARRPRFRHTDWTVLSSPACTFGSLTNSLCRAHPCHLSRNEGCRPSESLETTAHCIEPKGSQPLPLSAWLGLKSHTRSMLFSSAPGLRTHALCRPFSHPSSTPSTITTTAAQSGTSPSTICARTI